MEDVVFSWIWTDDLHRLAVISKHNVFDSTIQTT